jgi:hypothetical protein
VADTSSEPRGALAPDAPVVAGAAPPPSPAVPTVVAAAPDPVAVPSSRTGPAPAGAPAPRRGRAVEAPSAAPVEARTQPPLAAIQRGADASRGERADEPSAAAKAASPLSAGPAVTAGVAAAAAAAAGSGSGAWWLLVLFAPIALFFSRVLASPARSRPAPFIALLERPG